MTNPVVAGVLFVSLEGSIVSEPSFTAIAIGHWMVVVKRKRVVMGRSALDDSVFRSRVNRTSFIFHDIDLICKVTRGMKDMLAHTSWVD